MPYRGTLAEKVLTRAREIVRYVLDHDCHAVTDYTVRLHLGYSHSMAYHALRRLVDIGLAKKCLNESKVNIYWVCPQLCSTNIIEYRVNINLGKYTEYLEDYLERSRGNIIRITNRHILGHFLQLDKNDPYVISILMHVLEHIFRKHGAKYRLKMRVGYYNGLTFHTTRERMEFVLRHYRDRGITVADIC